MAKSAEAKAAAKAAREAKSAEAKADAAPVAPAPAAAPASKTPQYDAAMALLREGKLQSSTLTELGWVTP